MVIGAQVELDGQLLETPGVQDTNGFGVAMHWPSQPRMPSGKQVPVGVHVEPAGQLPAPPPGTPAPMQEINGGGVNID